MQRRKHNHPNAPLCLSVHFYEKTTTVIWLWPGYNSYYLLYLMHYSTVNMRSSHRRREGGTQRRRLAARSAERARIRICWGYCCGRPCQTRWFLFFMGWTLQSKTALGREKEKKRKLINGGDWGKRKDQQHTKKSKSSRAEGDRGAAWCWRWTKNGCLVIFAVVFLSEHGCVSFWDWDEDRKAAKASLSERLICLNGLKIRSQTKIPES